MKAPTSPPDPKNPQSLQLAYNVPEAAAFLRVSVPTVRRLIKRGQLREKRVGKRIIITRKNLLEFLE